MVGVGFIVEGDSEKIVIEAGAFREFLAVHGLELISPVLNAKGGGNLLPRNIGAFLGRLEAANAQYIFVLTDLEDEVSVHQVRERIEHERITAIFVAVKALEAWFLADTLAMSKWLLTAEFFEEAPEHTLAKPWDRLKVVAQLHGARGPGNKTAFAKRMVNHYGFDVRSAAAHPGCASAKELVDAVQSMCAVAMR